MSLSKAVKFQFLANQLTQNETRSFINKLFETHPKCIQMGLFYYILNTLPLNNGSNNINELISNIIRSRKKKPKQTTKQNIKLDSIPKPLAGVIASFLNQYDYINFSKCNRYIYLGCNTPNLMQELNLYQKDHSVNICLYPSITHFKLNLNKINKLIINASINNVPIINQLKYLSLRADKINNCDINQFITQNIINTNTITELKLSLFGKRNNKFDNAQLIQLLTQFSNINYLHFNAIYSDFDPNDIKQLYPNLKGLGLTSNTHQMNVSLLHLFANNLEYLILGEYSNNNHYDLDNFIFFKLKHLYLRRPRIGSINTILKTATNLQRVFIRTMLETNNKCFMGADETETIMKKLIISCKSLEYIEFVDGNGNLLESSLNGINTGLFLTKKWNRKKMKIKITITKPFRYNNHELIREIVLKIIHCLEDSNINDFMFDLRFNETNKNEIWNGLKDHLSSNVKLMEYGRGTGIAGFAAVFTNKNCNINGYQETWKFINIV